MRGRRRRAGLGRMLQTIERRFAGQRCAIPALARERFAEDAEHRIMAQLVVVDDVLVAERDAENALAEHRRKLVHDERRIATVLETIDEPRHESHRHVGLAEQERACIRGDRAAIERAHNIAALPKSNEPGIHSVGIGVAFAPA